ncbi:sporulation protein YabP [Seinonella peptonophila]|uniref:Sporulation protein YabP n=2 Tax=Seinonella peptonophila TaxID=112248 RepID=A0A1M4YRL0_9BACL|nr:sporulation protein YabP [Seinonella peptonophila]SHF08410.1 sporulation protein YabP [Seinonella peptonophila]
MVDENYGKQHELTMTNRNTLVVTGITRVESFDSEEFLLQTEYGYMGVRGQDLHLQSLDLDQGHVAIEGQIIHISYLDVNMDRTGTGKGLLGRLFR